ncbi:MAG: histidine triad nucleotide-binding protein [Thermodesulfovibrionales bacterium]
MKGCIFCSIISGNTPASVIHRDEHAIAFEDINPEAPVHVLVVPIKHISTPLDISEEDHHIIGHLFAVANSVAKIRGIAAGGFRLVMNCNRDAGQSVFHIHLHLLGGRPMTWPPG